MSTESHPKPKYGQIFVVLLVLTILEVFASGLPISKFYVTLILLGFAFSKAGLVAAFYMHLKWEKWYLWAIAFGPLAFSLFLVIVVGFDISHP